MCLCRLTLILFSSEHKVDRCEPPQRGSDVDTSPDDDTTLSLISQIRILAIILVELEGRGLIVGSEGTHIVHAVLANTVWLGSPQI